ncbi:endothelin-converting enzyme homolog [Musca autumnalis]|uniref:endothelin-converting enzyme homolog n=1 Tax=Musca autumnalis TaxID=221902 RepID=UPI003CF6CF9F
MSMIDCICCAVLEYSITNDEGSVLKLKSRRKEQLSTATQTEMLKVYLIFCIVLWQGSSDCLPFNATATNLDSPMGQEIVRYSKAAEIHNLMDETVDPCDNFYRFACGKWNRINPANTLEHASTGFFETVLRALNRKIAEVLSADDAGFENDIDRKVKNFFDSCMNLSTLRDVYKDKLLELSEEFGEIPVLVGDKWNRHEFDWLKTVSEMAYKYGIHIILGYDIMVDYADTTKNRLYIGYRGLPLESKSMYLEESNAVYREGYQSKMAKNLQRFLKLPQELAEVTAKELLEFEIGLAKGMIDATAGLQVTDITRLTTVDELHVKYGKDLDLKRYINISLGYVPQDRVYEMAEDYQKNLIQLIKETPKRVVANYIFYNFLEHFMVKVPKLHKDLQTKCIGKTKRYFAKNLDNIIYRRYNSNNTTGKAIDFMWHEIQTTFEQILLSDRLSWIGEETRNYAIEKLKAMQLEINSYEQRNFSSELGKLQLNKYDFVENLKSAMVLSVKNTREKLNEPPSALEAGEILSFTPANIIVENKIKVPVSLLQPYYVWSNLYPNAVQYGTLGSLISHELIHGFDDTGRNFDKSGSSHNWWDAKSTENFKNRTKCFIDQYKNYTYNGRKLPEMVSQSENIADNGGVRLAYAAYLRWYEDAARSTGILPVESLPRLKYSGKQLFFISYAQLWCSDVHPVIKNLQTSTDLHVPGKYRVIGPLSNFEEFSREFNCPIGSNMNRYNKCEIY